MDNEQSFQYTYNAAQQAEIEKIRSKYMPRQEDKMELLRKLDASASKKAKATAIALGVIGCLVMGTGMSLFMTELGVLLGDLSMVIGIVVGLIGIVLVALAYPTYNRILKTQRERIAPEILRLTDELMQ